MVINPFYQILMYFGTEYSPVTTEQLDHIAVSLYHAGLVCGSREQAFSVIQYLAENGVLDLIENQNETYLVKIKEH
jgi:hypothetical protein